MEETNYYRKPPTVKDRSNAGTALSADTIESAEGKVASSQQSNTETPAAEDERTYTQKPKNRLLAKRLLVNRLRLFRKEALHYPNRIRGMVLRPLLFLSFPIIFYAGLANGSNIVMFNVLNGTASLILSGKPYNFNSSIVGLCYISPLTGALLG